MTQIPCPNCSELLACGEDGIGRRMRCPRCRVMLRLDADADGRPAYGRPRRRSPLVRLAFVAAAFLAGLGIGFILGRHGSRSAPDGISASAVGVLSASNNVVVTERPAAPPGGR